MPRSHPPERRAPVVPPRADSLLSTYRAVLAVPGAPALAVASLVSKWPISMFPVSVLLLVSPDYSYAGGGAVVAAMLFANAASSPARGRLAGRYGAGRVLWTCLAGYLCGLGGIAVATACAAPLATVVAAALVMGVFFPPASILLRSYWTAIDRRSGRSSANALESALMDLTLITGPVLASSLSVSVAPVLPLGAVAALMTLAVGLLTRLPAATSGSARAAPPVAGPARVPPHTSRSPLLALLTAQFLFCAALAGTEAALPVYAQRQQAAAYSGWCLAGLSAGSITGALFLGRFSGRSTGRLPVLLGVLGLGMCGIGAAMQLGPVAVALVCPPAGLVIGSVFTEFFGLLGLMTPRGADHEIQGWANAMTTVGFAVGSLGGASLTGSLGASALVLCAPVAVCVSACLTAWSVGRWKRGRAGGR
ncbi:MFS transporter [Streptomyces sp. NRRL WC-3725]|uniref:MFS transporter n=1 Tax=Streptomyces sp. NRRL WC-3725 TaxID=1463933 RepID=UPI00131D7445|nr:MFS transporter [Streptomyces sp. NRRL WC-3725]